MVGLKWGTNKYSWRGVEDKIRSAGTEEEGSRKLQDYGCMNGELD